LEDVLKWNANNKVDVREMECESANQIQIN